MAAPIPASLASLTRRPLPLARNRVYRLWRGGALLDRMQGQPDPADRNLPEEWVGSTTVSRLPGRPSDEGLSRITLPDGGAVVLKELIEAFPEAMLGAAHVAHLGPSWGSSASSSTRRCVCRSNLIRAPPSPSSIWGPPSERPKPP